jgi:hypothetical protein
MRKLFQYRPSPAMVVACIALIVAMGGTGYAAFKLPKNSVGNRQLKKNAVTSTKIKNRQVRNADLARGSVSSSKIKNLAIGNSKLQPNSVNGGNVVDESLGSGDVAGLTRGDFADNQLTPRAFARVGPDGTLEPTTTPSPQTKGVDQTDVQHASTGIYCFGGLDFDPSTAMASSDNAQAAGQATDQIVSVAIQRGANLNGCDANHQQARVGIRDSAAALVDGRFTVWFER